jgi:signal transduction histidine kinase
VPRVFRADDEDGDAFIRDAQRSFGLVETIAVPITTGEQVLGVVCVARSEGPARGLSPALLARLEGLADQAAVALENARRLEQERAATDQLREADRLKSEFLAVVSHELRTPLSVMMGAARTLQWRGDGLETATRADLVESVVRRGEQLDRLVQDLLEASGDIKLEVAPVDLAAVVRMAVSDAAGLYPGAPIRCNANGDAVTVVADGFRVRQVVDNLLGNAAKYAPGATIEVDVGCTDRGGWLCVADAGLGMTADQVERAFDPFYQADSSAVRKVGGLGLGLHICRRIVHAHGGDIWIESQPGQGTRVKLSLPAEGPAT